MSCDPHENGEVDFYNKIKDSINVIFDVGCRTDTIFSDFVGDVHYFDPRTEFVDILKNKPNNHSNSYYNNFGLSDKNEIIPYYPSCQSFINRGLNMYERGRRVLELKVKIGESYCNDNNISIIDFLKIDTEGYELNVLKGLKEKIKDIKIIQFEYGQINKEICLKDIIKYLEDNDFENFSFLKKNGIVLITDFEEPPFCNIVCFNKLYKSNNELKTCMDQIMDTELIYSICYYYGKNKKSNIDRHMESYNRLNIQKQFIVTLMIDSHDESIHELAKQDILEYFSSIGDCQPTVLTSYNWGGTILGLWMVHKYISPMQNIHVAHFEEDYTPFNDDWLELALKLLKDNIYVGCTGFARNDNSKYGSFNRHKTHGRDRNEHFDKTPVYRLLTNDKEVWTDGGFYFSDKINLSRIEDTIGIFHKGNQNTKYQNGLDGIDIGEVGFPSLVFNAGLKIGILYKNIFFKHYN